MQVFRVHVRPLLYLNDLLPNDVDLLTKDLEVTPAEVNLRSLQECLCNVDMQQGRY